MMEMGENSTMTGLKESVGREITPVVRALQQGLGKNLVAVVLFGSRARGDAKEESDWDLLVIARSLPKRQIERYREMKGLLPPEWRGRISLLAKTPDEFEAALPTFYLEIALDGLILYDPQGYATAQFQKLRRLILSKGLRRERHGKDLVWQWETFPGFGWSLAWEEAT
jgi:predicted nucleotidyltransferase